ncbi:MAG: AraC family transcriptional regulator [Bacteroidaceae bacterium]
METNKLNEKYQTVCAAPSGNGFRIEHMPDVLLQSDINDCVPHVHAFYEILWFQQGKGIHTVDFTDYEVGPGCIFFLAPGQIHHFDDKEKYTGISIKMCTDFMKDEKDPGSLPQKYDIFHAIDVPPFYIIDDKVSETIAHLVAEMEREEANSKEFGNVDMLKALLRIFLINIIRNGRQACGKRADEMKATRTLFLLFRQAVERNFHKTHSVQDYANMLNVAVRTLNKCVNDCSGNSPLTLINNRIILEAKRMVRYTGMMVKEIALELGFEDPSYFVKFFKRQTGYLPSDFREADKVTHDNRKKTK